MPVQSSLYCHWIVLSRFWIISGKKLKLMNHFFISCDLYILTGDVYTNKNNRNRFYCFRHRVNDISNKHASVCLFTNKFSFILFIFYCVFFPLPNPKFFVFFFWRVATYIYLFSFYLMPKEDCILHIQWFHNGNPLHPKQWKNREQGIENCIGCEKEANYSVYNSIHAIWSVQGNYSL